MSSTNKTEYLNLNKWISSDIPKMQDFNNDNELIDTAFKNHDENEIRHITQQERNAWNNSLFLGIYFGNGELTRTIHTGCDFQPTAVMAYAMSKPVCRIDFTQQKKYNYFAIATELAEGEGISLIDNSADFTVKQQVSSSNGEYNSFNEAGTTYIYLMFR